MNSTIDDNFFFLELGLYQPVEFNKENYREIVGPVLIKKEIQFDCYCIECGKESPFKLRARSENARKAWVPESSDEERLGVINSNKDSFRLTFQCQRKATHVYSFHFRIAENQLIKVGQYPSIADLQIHDIKKYRSVLKSDYRDFSKAIGLFANGIGIGSYVYLRRIFENLIEESRQKAKEDDTWDDDKFQQSKMDVKIKLLRHYLPEFVVEHRQLYGIISKGIHELSEEECKEMFPSIKLAIELILDEKITILERESKIKSVGSFISEVAASLKNK